MAVTLTGNVLTAAEQKAQARLGAQYAALALLLWKKYATTEDVDTSFARIVELLVPQILKGRLQASTTSRKYYQTFRILETPDKTVWTPPAPIAQLDRSVIETSLRVTGPVNFKKKLEKISGADLEPAVEKALVEKFLKDAGEAMAAASMRHVVDGARQQVEADVRADKVALGFLRVTKSAQPCYFCAILASRGPVYKDESFKASDALFDGEGTAKAHDNCACVLEPVFSRSTQWPAQSRKAAEVWGNVSKGRAGRAAINAFRAAWES